MLDILRKRKRSWVIIVFLGIIVVVFVLWGVGSYVNEPRPEYVARVNGEVVGLGELELQHQRLVEVYRALFQGRLNAEAMENLHLKSVALDELIQKRLLLQEAERLGLRVSDEELAGSIARVPEFQVDGSFSKDRYVRVLRFRRLSPQQFEREQREELIMQRLFSLIQDAIQVSEAEARQRYRMEQEQVNFYFIRLPPEAFLDEVKLTDEEVQKHYERNREAFKEPLRVRVEYLSYPLERFAAAAEVKKEEVEDFYRSQKERRFTRPQAVRLRHILFRFPEGADSRQKGGVRAKAEAALKEARAGKDFAALAREHAEDPSAAGAGEAAWFTKGQLLPQLDQAAFELKKGQVSEVVEGPAGFHLIKVEEARREEVVSLKEATGEILLELKREKARIEAGKAADADRSRAMGGAELSELAKERALEVRLSPLFSRDEGLPPVGREEDFYRGAFTTPVEGLSPVIEGRGAYYLVKVKERREPAVPALASIRARVEQQLKARQAFELASQKAQALLQELGKHRDIRALARQHGLRLQETGWFARSGVIPRVGDLRELKPGGIPLSARAPVADRVYTTEDALFLFAFKESRGADMKVFEKDKERLLEQARAEKRQSILQRYLEGIKAQAKIEIQPQFLDRG